MAYDSSTYNANLEKYLQQFQGASYRTPEQRQSDASKGTNAQKPSGGSAAAGLGATALTMGASIYGRQKLIDYLKNRDATPAITTQNPAANLNASTQANWNAGADSATAAMPTEAKLPDGGIIEPNGSVVHPDGTTVTPDGNAIAADGTGMSAESAAQYLGYALAAYQAYDAINNSDTDKQRNIGLGNAAISAGQAYTGGSPYLSGAQFALGGYQTLDNDNMTGEEKATRLQQQAALAAADYFTFGLATPLEGLVRGTGFGSKIGKKLDALDQKTNPMTMVLGGMLGGKDRDQMMRDQVRNYLVDRGVLSPDYQYTDTQGNTFNMGLDGGARLQNFAGANIDNEADRGTYDVDFTNPLAANTVGYLNPLSAITTRGQNDKLTSDTTGMLTNAALSGAKTDEDARREALALYLRSGLDTRDKAVAALDQNREAVGGNYDAYLNGINQVFSDSKLRDYLADSIGSSAPVSQNGAVSDLVYRFPQGTTMNDILPTINAIAGNNSGSNAAGISIDPGYINSYTNIPAQPTRSSTLSPGIDKNGRRISYGRR